MRYKPISRTIFNMVSKGCKIYHQFTSKHSRFTKKEDKCTSYYSDVIIIFALNILTESTCPTKVVLMKTKTSLWLCKFDHASQYSTDTWSN